MDFKKINIYYIVTLLFVLVSANASFLSASDLLWAAVIVFMFIVALQKKILTQKTVRTLVIFSLVYLLFVAVRDLLINALEIRFLVSDIVFLFKLIYLTYLYCILLKDKASAYLVDVITHLTVISFFFYLFQLVQGDTLYKFSTALNLQTNNTVPGYTNFLIFTFHKNFHDFANSGFSWEPGAFGCFLIIALLLNLFLKKFKFDSKSVVLIIGIATTAATTDYLALIVVLFLVYRYRVPKINLGAVILIMLFIGVVILIPFLGSKIKDTYYEDLDDLKRLKYLEVFYRHNKMQIPLNRFSSMVYIFNTFTAQLILGVSNKYDEIVNKAFNINISNGIFDFLPKFGLVGFIYLIYNYGRFCIQSVRKVEYLIYCILVLLVIGFGEPILVLPIVLMFIFLPAKQVNLQKRGRGLPGEGEEEEAEDPLKKYLATSRRRV